MSQPQRQLSGDSRAFSGDQRQKPPGNAVIGLVMAFLLEPVGLAYSLIALRQSTVKGGRNIAIAGIVISSSLMIVKTIFVLVMMLMSQRISGPTDAVIALNEAALNGGTCESFIEVSTESYRADVGLADCGSWDQFQASRTADFTDYTTQIVSVDMGNGQATVETSETAITTYHGLPTTARNAYTVVERDGVWKVDSVVAHD